MLAFCIKGFAQDSILIIDTVGNLLSFNATNCTTHYKGSTGLGFADIAFTPNGQLLGISGGNLYRIDTASAQPTLIGNTSFQANTLVALNDTVLAFEYGMNLYRLNVSNATSTILGNLGYTSSGDLSWKDGRLYMSSGALLITIQLDTNQTSIVFSNAVNTISNPLPFCRALSTAYFNGDNQSLIGFAGTNAFKICAGDGSYQLMCPSVLPHGISGAASIALPASHHILQCGLQSVSTLSESSDLLIYPNPFNDKLFVESKEKQKVDITLFDLTARKVLQQSFSGNAAINTDHLAKGVYLYEVKNNNGIIKNGKLIKE